MGHIITDLLNRFKQGNIHIQLIYINVAVFVVFALLRVFGFLWGSSFTSLIESYVSLPSSLNQLMTQPWSLITYMFMHQGVWHLFFNMLCLFWFGELFLSSFSARHLRGLYILGGLVGGVFFILASNSLPVLQSQLSGATLVGASAAIMAITVAVAFKLPNYPVNLFLIGEIRMKYIAGAMVLISVVSVSGSNSGGEFAHLGGALVGWFFTRQLNHGHDIVAWINSILDLFNWISPQKWRASKSSRKAKMKIHSEKDPKDWEYNVRKKNQNNEIDRILEKLKQSGYESLTTEEKKKLFDESKRG